MHILAWTLGLFSYAQDARPLSSTVRDVTVFADRALVHRVAAVPAGGGAFLVGGLPLGADPEQIRVSCKGGDVTNVDVTEVRAPAMADARREELRKQLVALGRDEAALEDERRTLEAGMGAASEMLTLGSSASRPEVLNGKLDVTAWSSDQDALLARLRSQKKALRELLEQREELARKKHELETALGAADVAGGALARQVALEVIASAATTLEIEYVVSNAGWSPYYDLRTAADAKTVQLVYRADVFQRSGEDWDDVDVSLSTALPQLGAQGPEPRPAWVGLFDPRAVVIRGEVDRDEQYLGKGEKRNKDELKELGYDGPATAGSAAPAAPRPFASVESQGLSVRFHLPRKESLPSRPEPTRVLVAEEALKVTPEYFCTPALDTHVWLRGKATNTTQWTILPGRAAVYFGADFLGHANLAAVQPGEELVLHLGSDPGFTVERVQTENQAKQPGVFGSRVTQVDGWRVKLENHGALVGGEGGATVFVREALPRARDDRIKIELADAKPEPSADARWKKDRDEQGFVTWVVNVPRGGKLALDWRVKVSFPEGMQIQR